ncbi:hypothetical protein LCGC14_2988650, partial [marine sediment metagenome]
VTGSPGAVITLDTTAGVVFQLNPQTFPALDMAGADDIHLRNLSGSEFSTSVNLVADITTLADGVTPIGNNKYFNLVIWGGQNRTGQTSHLYCNLPIGQYGKQGDAIVDAEKFSVHTIPNDFRGVGFLIGELTFQFSSGGGGTWALIQERVLLGHFPILIPGGGTTTIISTFVDSSFEIFGNLDDTKRIAFQADSITTGTTRIITMADVNVDLADIATNNAKVSNVTHTGDVTGATALTLDLNNLGTETSIASGDFLAMVDITDSGSEKITFDNLQANIVKTGALNSGSITSGFGNIDIGSSTIDAGTIDGTAVTATTQLVSNIWKDINALDVKAEYTGSQTGHADFDGTDDSVSIADREEYDGTGVF